MDAWYFNLAKNLVGRTVGQWIVDREILNKGSTGGNFSVGYEVHNAAGQRGFLKALDYSAAFKSADPVQSINSMSSAYLFERTLLTQCTQKRLRHIVRIIDYGRFTVSQDQLPPGKISPYPLEYLVMEMADFSVRSLIDLSRAFDNAWALRSLHNVAVGIEEMHSIQVAHQDIKPSNVLFFNKEHTSKLGDVGRSSSMTMPAKHDEFDCAGDMSYSPFEQLYGENHTNWKIRRFSCDMFMFGNLIMTYFNNVSVTMAVLNRLPSTSLPNQWGDTYKSLLPQLETAFAECLSGFNHSIDCELRTELVAMVQQLCCPDIAMRGDLKNSHLGTQQYSLQRYVTKLDLLARKYEYHIKQVI